MVTNQQKITIMKKLYYFLLLLPLWGSGGLSAQVSVELMGKTPPQVFFTVSWGAKAPYNNKIWVLAQVSTSGIGAEERALVTEVSATGATASTVTGHRGFWLETSGVNGSATVSATLGLAPGVEHFNWCVYAFDYPPNAVLQPDGSYQLRGSPPFIINDDITEYSNTFGPGTCITSFTDATNNPEGIVPAPIAWFSGGDVSQTVTVGDAITPITFETTCTTCTISVTSSKLPDGVSGTWTSPNYTVSGIPVLTGTYNYTLTAEEGNGCSHTSVIGTIKVEAPPGTYQDQGSCTFTQPAVLSTFALFPATYSASTFATLTDERDGNNYAVVKMPDGKWWMAQNLNYQKDLTWTVNSNQPSTGNGQNTALIGHFWCPGVNGAMASTRASCDVWGALYSFETAMMVDGKWSDDTRTNTAWTDVSPSNNTTSGNTNNGGKGAGSHGICPANWHVPTDAEWGNLFNAMESSTKNHNTGTGHRGAEAVSKSKSTCSCGNGVTGSNCMDDINNNWLYDANVPPGSDAYGFRVVPAGHRHHDGTGYYTRGDQGIFRSSSAATTAEAWARIIYHTAPLVNRNSYVRGFGFSVRCVRN
jgi:uncharacterized protein (TIGR02145 family)